MADTELLDKLVSLSKRRGYVFQSSEIYGGTGSVWDYGPLGVELKRNVKEAWWRAMVHERDDIEGLDAAILMHPRVWEASGHLANFTDPLVECGNCHRRYREDTLQEQAGTAEMAQVQCPACGTRGKWSEPRQFNLMFKTFMGPVEEDASTVYLRPETAQGIFVNFLNVQTSARQRVPFGIAQIGKAFRNEITPGNFTFRTREFEQMEMQFFVKPGSDDEWFERWREERFRWHTEVLGLSPERLRYHPHEKLAHYARAAGDVEFHFGGTIGEGGWGEIEGIHNRTDFDLTQHQQFSGKKLQYVDTVSNEKYVPYVIETSVGADRATLAVLANAYREEEVEGETRVVLAIKPSLAPLKCGVFPLVKKDGMPERADAIHQDLRRRGIPSFYDEAGAIGRRYRRQDEAGTPFCITVDGETMEQGTVTVRDRDSMQQTRISQDEVAGFIQERIR
ncbi:MAG: Glycyl-tRNA synthetase [uncultured Gemmatimonadetes bacterium]|uniref:Glycine--tRNA ligase n=1 Tax=uncultured Gemmatimonadota bacterium TaxID=203437 RepID=A0A6J4K4Z4_9BACT|nr:MAG: Glycyl-tRNA synthetase [uncultured Gemmatimonadota bacterium]